MATFSRLLQELLELYDVRAALNIAGRARLQAARKQEAIAVPSPEDPPTSIFLPNGPAYRLIDELFLLVFGAARKSSSGTLLIRVLEDHMVQRRQSENWY